MTQGKKLKYIFPTRFKTDYRNLEIYSYKIIVISLISKDVTDVGYF